MLTEISLKNFKIFEEKTTFPLSKINLLTGINGRGKSSLLQSILLIKQSVEFNQNTNRLYLNGNCVRLGTFQDVKNVNTGANEDFEIGFEYDDKQNDRRIKVAYTFGLYENIENVFIKGLQGNDEKKQFLMTFKDGDVYQEKDMEGNILYEENRIKTHSDSLFPRISHQSSKSSLTGKSSSFTVSISIMDILSDLFQNIHYISADRIGPKDFYLKENLGSFINVGTKGENTASVLSLCKNDQVDEKLYLGQDANTLLQQIEEWLKYIFGEAKFNIDDSKNDIIYLLFNTQPKNPNYKPSNVGFGFSYILPIIVSGLIAQTNSILIVENPEAHLHPKAQAKLTEFLAKIASCGVQVFVESHSEHILNGLRIAVVRPDIEIQNTDVNVLYFHEKQENDAENDYSKNKYFTQIPISAKGKITTRLEGFFDQITHDLDILLRVK